MNIQSIPNLPERRGVTQLPNWSNSFYAFTQSEPVTGSFPVYQDINWDIVDGGDECERLYFGDTHVDSTYVCRYFSLIKHHVSRRPIIKSKEADSIITEMINGIEDLIAEAQDKYNHLTKGKP
jgi:hypothetical protein